jgi:putative membrane protein insertion efficiency factor
MVRFLVALIRLYQRILSPFLGNVCRFEPSCSRYAKACLEGHGAVMGSLLSIRRLCKCHPFHPGGYDPPPPKVKFMDSPRLITTASPPLEPAVAGSLSSSDGQVGT